MIRALALVVALSLPATAQEAPTIAVALDPAEPVTVGAPVTVAITVLVPTFMPDPPVWPDLQIADAITRLPERATRPVTTRIGEASWSGLTRTYEIIPQRAADYDLADATVTLTWAGADNSPQQATLPVPDIAFSAIVPPGAEGLDPFLAAGDLTVTATAEGLPDTPTPGDALTLTLTTTASGPPAMMLPPLAGRIATPAGLRAYPKEAELADTAGERGEPPTATRVETVTYVIEAPGSYTLPAISLDWWNTGSRSVASATTDAIAFDVAVPPGWKETAAGDPTLRRANWIAVSLAVLAAVAASVLLRRWRAGRGSPRPPSEREVYRRLRRTVRTGPTGALRASVRDWMQRVSPDDPALGPDIEAALLALERSAYGSAGGPGAIPAAGRRALLAALQDRRRALGSRKRDTGGGVLPALNPSPTAQAVDRHASGAR